MILTVVELFKNILDYIKDDQNIKLDNRLRISSVLQEISEILIDTANKLSKDEYPHYNCVLIERLSEQLHFHLIDFVKPLELDNLYNTLKEASQIEKLFAIRKEPHVIPEIEKAAAEFRAFALLMKI